jgi:hypothetical protein
MDINFFKTSIKLDPVRCPVATRMDRPSRPPGRTRATWRGRSTDRLICPPVTRKITIILA